MSPAFLETASFWSNVAVVVFGIAAALAAGFALYFGSRLGAAKDAELERFQIESRTAIATADARAADANKQAAEATSGTARALVDAAEANKTAEGFRLEIANANERAAAANEAAERERLARLQLEARLADRVVTEEQKSDESRPQWD